MFTQKSVEEEENIEGSGGRPWRWGEMRKWGRDAMEEKEEEEGMKWKTYVTVAVGNEEDEKSLSCKQGLALGFLGCFGA